MGKTSLTDITISDSTATRPDPTTNIRKVHHMTVLMFKGFVDSTSDSEQV